MTGEPSERRAGPGGEAPRGARETPPRPGTDASRKGADRLRALAGGRAAGIALAIGVLALGLGASALLVAGELSPVYTTEIEPAGNCEIIADPTLREQCAPTGAERHSYALFLLAALALVMSLGAGRGRSAPAAAALVLIGLAALAIVLIGDLPDVGEPGSIRFTYEAAATRPASGFWLSLAGGGLALLAGVVGLLAGRRQPS